MKVRKMALKQGRGKMGPISILIFGAMLFMAMPLKAQTESEDVEWTFIQETGGVKFYYEEGICDGQAVLFLKILNENVNQISGTWQLIIEADKKNFIFSDIIMTVNSRAESIGNCNPLDPALVIPIDISSLQLNKIVLTASIINEQ